MVWWPAPTLVQSLKKIDRHMQRPTGPARDGLSEDMDGQIPCHNRALDGCSSLLGAVAKSYRKPRLVLLNRFEKFRLLYGATEHPGLEARHCLGNQQKLR